jgi:hypothetical protein
VDPVPDQLLLRKSGSGGNQTRELWFCSQELWPLDHGGGNHCDISVTFFSCFFFSHSNTEDITEYRHSIMALGQEYGWSSWIRSLLPLSRQSNFHHYTEGPKTIHAFDPLNLLYLLANTSKVSITLTHTGPSRCLTGSDFFSTRSCRRHLQWVTTPEEERIRNKSV